MVEHSLHKENAASINSTKLTLLSSSYLTSARHFQLVVRWLMCVGRKKKEEIPHTFCKRIGRNYLLIFFQAEVYMYTELPGPL